MLGVWAPAPHGVFSSSLPPVVSEYIPSRVEEVRFKMERVRLGGGLLSEWLRIRSSGFWASVDGDGGNEESAEAGVRSKVLRGIGR